VGVVQAAAHRAQVGMPRRQTGTTSSGRDALGVDNDDEEENVPDDVLYLLVRPQVEAIPSMHHFKRDLHLPRSRAAQILICIYTLYLV
jgi:hypothetical protein